MKKESIFINHSNHPSDKWSEEQIKEAKILGNKIIDIPFPTIDPEWEEFTVVEKARDMMGEIVSKYGDYEMVIHIMGESTYVYSFVLAFENALRLSYNLNGMCVASTTKRDVVENPDGSKTVKFKFVRFRAYIG